MAEPTPPGAKPAAKPAPAKPAPAKAAAPAKPGAKGAPAPAAPAEPAVPTNKAEIHARLRKGRPSRFEVVPAGAVLGRDDTAAVPLPLEGVSREHARIKWDGKGWSIEDLKSTNGTFVNGERVVRERLQHLDVISLGRKADLIFVLRSLAEAAPVTRKGIVRAALADAEGAEHEVPIGEFTLGRSAACNLKADVNAVSKVHARIERSSDQLLLEDLASSNGTFLNGARVRTAILRDGDILELAGVAKYKVVVEQGDTNSSGFFRPAPVPAAAKEGQPQFSGEWKTRYEWDPEELAAIAAAAAGVRPAELDRVPTPTAGPRNVVQAGATKAVAVTPPPAAPAKPGAPPPKPMVVPAPPPGPAALEQPVPRPVKTLAEAAAAAKPSPAPGRPPTPAGSDPSTTPGEPGLHPAPAGVRSPIVPSVEPAGAPAAASPTVPAAPKPAAPKPAAAAPAAPAKPAAAAPTAPAKPAAAVPAASAKPAAPPVRPAPAPAPAAAPPPAEEAPVEYSATVIDMPAPVSAAVPVEATPAASAPIAALRLTGERFAFEINMPGRYEMGRATGAPLRIDHTTVSRRHAALILSDDRRQVTVEDLGAANGTRVNRTEVKKGSRELKDGDVLELGEVRFTVAFERG
jgi:pSer/pThr/pTyr-binding forkhead associated (FHA) protein